MKSQQDDWERAASHAAAACVDIETSIVGKLDSAQARVDALQQKVQRVQTCAQRLRDDGLMAERSAALAAVAAEAADKRAQVEACEKQLRELKVQTDAERADLELIKDKERLLRELGEKTAAEEVRADQLAVEAAAAEEKAATARNEKAKMEQALPVFCVMMSRHTHPPLPTSPLSSSPSPSLSLSLGQMRMLSLSSVPRHAEARVHTQNAHDCVG